MSQFTSQRFINDRTGEIVTQVPLSQIAHFHKYDGELQPGEFAQLEAETE
jgi:hypothetical protein